MNRGARRAAKAGGEFSSWILFNVLIAMLCYLAPAAVAFTAQSCAHTSRERSCVERSGYDCCAQLSARLLQQCCLVTHDVASPPALMPCPVHACSSSAIVCAAATAALILHTDEQVQQHIAAAVSATKSVGRSAQRHVQQGICNAQRFFGGEL
jgi:hypothetical protein